MKLHKYFSPPYTMENMKKQFLIVAANMQSSDKKDRDEMIAECKAIVEIIRKARRLQPKATRGKKREIEFTPDEKEFIKDVREFALFTAKNILDGVIGKISKF